MSIIVSFYLNNGFVEHLKPSLLEISLKTIRLALRKKDEI